jgi:hypothetical protein
MLIMRLEVRTSGVALVGALDAAPGVTLSMSLFFYGDDAGNIAAASEQKWSDWLRETFASEEKLTSSLGTI